MGSIISALDLLTGCDDMLMSAQVSSKWKNIDISDA